MTILQVDARLSAGSKRPGQLTHVVIHHTGGGESGMLPTLIDRGLSYHYAIRPNGEILQLVEPSQIAFHARHLNPVSIGIAFIGNMMDQEPTEQAYNSCLQLIFKMGWTGLTIVGHGDEMATVCPGRVDIQRILNDKDNPSNWARYAWTWATQQGITDGNRPTDNVTRQELVTMLYRLEKMR